MFPMVSFITLGSGPDTCYVEEMRRGSNSHIQRAYSLGLRAKGVFARLDEVVEDCSSVGWDGENAMAVSKNVHQYASFFLDSLPLGFEAPDINAELDGSIEFEWYRNPRRVISLSVSQDGNLYYAALIGTSRRHGSDSIQRGVSEDLVELIKRHLGGGITAPEAAAGGVYR